MHIIYGAHLVGMELKSTGHMDAMYVCKLVTTTYFYRNQRLSAHFGKLITLLGNFNTSCSAESLLERTIDTLVLLVKYLKREKETYKLTGS